MEQCSNIEGMSIIHETWRMEGIEQQLKWTKCTVPDKLPCRHINDLYKI